MKEVIGLSTQWMITLAAVVLWLVPPAYVRWTARAHVSTNIEYGPAAKRTLFVHLAGYVGDGSQQIQNVKDAFLPCGDLLMVHYEGDNPRRTRKFDVDLVVKVTTSAIVDACKEKRYQNVVFIGTSMGGKMAYLVARELRVVGIATKAIFVDTPLTGSDFQSPLDKLAYVLRALLYVPVANLLFVVRPFEILLVKFALIPPPKEKDIDPKLSWDEHVALDGSVKWAQGSRLSYCRDQVGAIMKPLDPSLQSPWTVDDIVYIWSMGDKDTVRGDQASRKWATQLGIKGLRRVTLKGALHCAYGPTPSPYREGFARAFRLLGIS